MEQQITQLVEQRINELYMASITLLRDNNSYQQPVNLENVDHYIRYLELSLIRPYNRLAALHGFIIDEDGLFTNRMYPFRQLREEIKANIKAHFSRVVKLALALDVSGIDPEFEGLQKEDFEL